MFNTILTNIANGVATITFNRPEARNSINGEFLYELNSALDQFESDKACKMVVFEGQDGIFCTGMDFQAYTDAQDNTDMPDSGDFTSSYMALLRRISLFPKVIVSKVDGQVMAGGVGIAAASDLVVATPRSQFSLSEALWGLLPSMVLPYLVRRVGFQPAYKMTLTTMPITAEEANRVNLVDEVSENIDTSIRKLGLKLMRLEESTISNMKEYFRSIWIIDENIEQAAIEKTSYLSKQENVVRNIQNFVKYKKFPWEK